MTGKSQGKTRTRNAARALDKARRGRYAIGAFNAGTFETIRAIVNAAVRLRAPVILEASAGEISYFGIRVFANIVNALRSETAVPIFMNLDHAHDARIVRAAVQAGFDLVHYDGSLLKPKENARHLSKLVQFAHRAGSLVEGEREHIGGSSTLHAGSVQAGVGELTDPLIALAFVRSTRLDTLAVSVGEAHGLYAGTKHIDVERIRRIRRAVPCHLALHGGSGIPDREIRQAIRAGITKINVNTELRLAFATRLRRELRDPKNIVPYEYFPAVIKSVERIVEAKIRLFGSTGKA